MKMKQNTSALEVIEFHLTEDVIAVLVVETNRYAKQFMMKNPEKVNNS